MEGSGDEPMGGQGELYRGIVSPDLWVSLQCYDNRERENLWRCTHCHKAQSTTQRGSGWSFVPAIAIVSMHSKSTIRLLFRASGISPSYHTPTAVVFCYCHSFFNTNVASKQHTSSLIPRYCTNPSKRTRHSSPDLSPSLGCRNCHQTLAPSI